MRSLSNRICFKPWDFMEIEGDWGVSSCGPAWTGGYKYGAIDANLAIEPVWNSERAQDFRRSILDGSFEFCDHTLCPMIQNGSLPDRRAVHAGACGPAAKAILDRQRLTSAAPTFINLAFDRSCNLQCPSCRDGVYSLNKRVDPAQFQRKREMLEQLLEYGYKAKPRTTINVTGSGDPFASALFRDFMTQMDGARNRNLHLQLHTNGVLFTPENWGTLDKMHGNPISAIISLDAGTAATYAVTRRGGDWAKLMKNLEFVADLYRKRQLTWVRLDFVCQRLNYREMPLFVEIAKRHGFFCYFSRILEWKDSGYEGSAFFEHDVFNPLHREHREFLKVVNQDFGYDQIDFGNISRFRSLPRIFLGELCSKFLSRRAAALAEPQEVR